MKSDEPRRPLRTNDDSSTSLNGINAKPSHQRCSHQKHQTEGTSRPLLSRHVPDVNPCNTNPNARKRPTHHQTFVSTPEIWTSPYHEPPFLSSCRKEGPVHS